MGPEWKTMPFSEAVSINPKVPLTKGKTYPFVEMAAVNSDARCAYMSEEREFKGGGSRFQSGDTLLARITPCLENGKIARYCATHGVFGHGSTEFIVIRGKEEVSTTAYAYYLTKWENVRGYAISQMTGTSGRQRVPTASLDHLEVPLPPIYEQYKVADILGTLDDKIDLNRQMNCTLEAMARAIFKAWFVDFEPVRAKADGATSFRGMPQAVFDRLPDRFIDTEVGQVPEGWEIRPLADVVSITKGRSYKSSELVEGDTALVTLKSFKRGGGYRKDGLKPYNGKFKPAQVVEPGELVVAFTDVTQQAEVIGKPALVLPDPRYSTLVASLDTSIVRPLSNEVTKSFLYCLFMTEEFQAHAYGHTSGTTVLHLGKNALPSYQFVCPPRYAMESFEEVAGAAFLQVEKNESESRTLSQLRDTLLPKLVSGEMRVPIVEEATDGG